MNTLKEHILSDSLKKSIQEVILLPEEVEMINESLNNPHLLSLAKQLRENPNMRDFAHYFGGYYQRIAWEKIDASRSKEYDFVDDKAISNARKTIKNGGLVIVVNKDGSYSHVFKDTGNGDGSKSFIYIDHEDPQYSSYGWNSMSATEMFSTMKRSHGIVTIDLNSRHGEDLSVFNLQWDRQRNREGYIPTEDPKKYADYCKEEARKNISRYKEIIKKHQAERTVDYKKIDTLVHTCLNRMMAAVEKFQKDPDKYITEKYTLSMIMSNIYDEKRWMGGSRGYSGNDGLLVLFNRYNEMYIEIVTKTAGSWSNIKDLERLDKEIKDKADSLDAKLVKFGV